MTAATTSLTITQSPAPIPASGMTTGAVRTWLRLEGLAAFVIGVALFGASGGNWLFLVPLLLLPDVSAIGYLAGPRIGSFTYNVVHNWVPGFVTLGIGAWLASPDIMLAAAILGDDEIRRRLRALPATPDGHHAYAGGLLEHTVGVATVCRELCQLHPRLRADLLLAAALLHDVGRTIELEPGPGFRQTAEGRLLGHVHLGTRLIEERAVALDPDARAELLHAVACHHDARAAKTAEAAVLYHANQLDAVAATRPVDGT